MSIKFGPGIPRLETSFGMPQVTNPKVWREKELSPVGPGTVFNRVNEICAATRERARLINKTEELRLERIQRLIDKEHRFNNNIQSQVIQRTSKTLKEKRALLQILQTDYRYDNFLTTKPRFDPSHIEDKETARHYIIESRVFNSGFNMKAMKPEVYRRIRKLDPAHKHKAFKRKLLAEVKGTNVEINRTISNSAFRKMLHDREHWRDYNYPPDHQKWLVERIPQSELLPNKDTGEDLVAGSYYVAAEHPDENSESVTEKVEAKEKSIVLERRLARPKADAFSMTMRTLGPVYFQTSVNSEGNMP